MEKKIVPVQYVTIPCEEDEIDLKEIIKTILKYKKFIIFFTLTITILTTIYAFIKTPIYEIKSNIMIGQINGKPVVSNKEVAEYIKALYKKDLEKKFKTLPNAYLSKINIPKNSNTFLTLIIDGISNKYSLKKKDEILHQIQKAFNYKIEKYITEEKNKLQNLKTELKSIEKIKKLNIKNEISTLKLKISINTELIKFYTNKLEILEKQINTIKKKLTQLYKLINNKNLSIINITFYQNLINNLSNKQKELELEKIDIITHKLPNLKTDNKNFSNKIENLKQILTLKIPQEKNDILNQIKLTKISLKNTFFTKEIGKPLISNEPIKPKKKLIIILAFITSFILSIFLIFLIEFIKSLKENE